MEEKQGPPSYESSTTANAYNAGYVQPTGDQTGAPGYPTQYGMGYGQPQQAGYPQPQQGGYPQPHQGGYPQPQQGGYPQPQQGGYPQQYGGNFSQSSSSNVVVVNQPTGQGMVINSVPDHMGLAIFTTICCCWPLGLVAIMRAQESRRALDRGDMVSASTNSAEARRYSMWAIAGGCLSVVITIIIIVVVVSQRSTTYYYG